MAKYTTSDGRIVDTSKAVCHWEENTRWNGNNHISCATGSQWEHETLYLSKKDNFYLEHESQWQGTLPWADFISDEEATRWLLANGHELPDALQALAAEIEE